MKNSTPESLKKLAAEMNISESDLNCFAQGVINSMTKDKIVDSFLSMGDTDQAKITSSYAANEGRKMEQFTTTYLTKAEARDSFVKQVHGLL